MPTTQSIQEPILVRNPYTGRHVNVAPLFEAMHLADGVQDDSISNLKASVSQIIRAVNLSWQGDSATQKNVNYDLYLLEDMFAAMSEFKQGA